MTLAEALLSRKSDGRCAFVPFVTAGDPSLKGTARFLRTLEKVGADIIELGVPFSDPVADGAVIQSSYQRALRAGATLSGVLNFLKRLRGSGMRIPVVLFTYLNPVLRLGYGAFARRCSQSGVNGVLVVDLPAEEAAPLASALSRRGVEPVLLASPTTSEARLRRIGRLSGSIVYYVSREGVTGVRKGLAPGLKARLRKVKVLVKKPLIVGFGVARSSQARALAPLAEGVVVGSALVGEVAASASISEACRNLHRRSRSIISGLRS